MISLLVVLVRRQLRLFSNLVKLNCFGRVIFANVYQAILY